MFRGHATAGIGRTLMIQMIHPTRILLTAAFSLLSALSVQAQPSYTVTDLGNLWYGSSNATSINNRGEVGGNTQGIAFLYHNRAMHDIGAGLGSSVWAVNDRGDAIGSAGDPYRYYFLYTAGTVHQLTAPNSGVIFTGINNSGVLIGWRNGPTGYSVGFRYINGHYQMLGILPGEIGSAPCGINSQGQIVGTSGHAVLWDNGHMQDLGFLGSSSAESSTTALSINDHGQVVGYSEFKIQNVWLAHAFFYSAGVMRDLGTLAGYSSSIATCINNSGEIVGYCDSDTSVAGFLYVSGHMYDLTKLLVPNTGWTIQSVGGINDSGQISVTGWGNNVAHALLLTPTRAKMSVVR
jgi:probable HAF family extracellular repeat protein